MAFYTTHVDLMIETANFLKQTLNLGKNLLLCESGKIMPDFRRQKWLTNWVKISLILRS